MVSINFDLLSREETKDLPLGSFNEFIGTAGDDLLEGIPNADPESTTVFDDGSQVRRIWVNGLEGSDVILGDRLKPNVIYGGPGSDEISGGSKADQLSAGSPVSIDGDIIYSQDAATDLLRNKDV